MVTQTKEEALELLERTRTNYLAEARDVARSVCDDKGWVCVDDVRALCPPPPGVDPRVMGAIFRDKREWEPTDFIVSERKKCHKSNRMRRFVRVG